MVEMTSLLLALFLFLSVGGYYSKESVPNYEVPGDQGGEYRDSAQITEYQSESINRNANYQPARTIINNNLFEEGGQDTARQEETAPNDQGAENSYPLSFEQPAELVANIDQNNPPPDIYQLPPSFPSQEDSTRLARSSDDAQSVDIPPSQLGQGSPPQSGSEQNQVVDDPTEEGNGTVEDQGIDKSGGVEDELTSDNTTDVNSTTGPSQQPANEPEKNTTLATPSYQPQVSPAHSSVEDTPLKHTTAGRSRANNSPVPSSSTSTASQASSKRVSSPSSTPGVPTNVTTPPIFDDSPGPTEEQHPTQPSESSEDQAKPDEESEEETITAITIFFVLVLLGISVLMVHLFITFKFHYLPESIGFVAIGFLIGSVLLLFEKMFGYNHQFRESLSPQFFFLVLLPPIIFESGYSLHKGNFFQNLGSIMMFAVFGTAFSAVIVGGGIYGLGVMGVIYKLDLIQSFTFGSLISAVDPVATLAIFHALDVDPTLNMLVFGESVLNDAVSIVLTNTILKQLPSSSPLQNGTADNKGANAASILGNSAWQFCLTFFGSAILGILSALFSAIFLKYINLRRHQSLEFAMWVIFAFGPYFLAEGMHLSGIMAVLFCGIVMSHYTHFNLSPITQVTVQQALRTVAFMAETGVFLYLGMGLFSISNSFDIALIIWSLVLILIGRAVNIFPITTLMNRCRSVKISLRMQCIMWYSGLRGAVAFALAMNLNPYFGKEVTGYIVTTTLVIVLFTIVILGGSTLPLLIFLRADKGAKLTLSKTEDQDATVSGPIIERGTSKLNLRSFRGLSKAFLYAEFRYIRPWFIRRFTKEEVKAARFEMQQKTVEWYQGLREASMSEEETDMSTTTGSSLLHSPI